MKLTVRKCAVCNRVSLLRDNGKWTEYCACELEVLKNIHEVTVQVGTCDVHVQGDVNLGQKS